MPLVPQQCRSLVRGGALDCDDGNELRGTMAAVDDGDAVGGDDVGAAWRSGKYGWQRALVDPHTHAHTHTHTHTHTHAYAHMLEYRW
jgi:hypothetical protein